MISDDLVQKAIMGFLRADVNLMAALSGTTQILEGEYQGQDFIYPNVRVFMQPQQPIGNGVDRPKLSTVHWTIRCSSEQPSAQEANHLMGLVVNALFTKQITGTDYNNLPNFSLVRIDLANSAGAVRIADRIWVATAIFQSAANPLIAP